MTTTIADRPKDSALLIDDETCRLFRAGAELAGQKWTAAVLLAMASGAERFSDIRGLVDGVSDRILSARLKDLEHQKLLARHVVPTTPVQVRYTLTPQGRELIAILQPLVSWGVRWKLQPSE
ncbi:MAG: transcriptional regulator [Microbacteriaceae bacterium]|jgi:DNA-binding HxlR family transcriptional regulator|nr:transcriptional regulator [Microbacteriaceae bacterium]